jgi:hypothetical protein
MIIDDLGPWIAVGLLTAYCAFLIFLGESQPPKRRPRRKQPHHHKQ